MPDNQKKNDNIPMAVLMVKNNFLQFLCIYADVMSNFFFGLLVTNQKKNEYHHQHLAVKTKIAHPIYIWPNKNKQTNKQTLFLFSLAWNLVSFFLFLIDPNWLHFMTSTHTHTHCVNVDTVKIE